jgi:hypothetical protein
LNRSLNRNKPSWGWNKRQSHGRSSFQSTNQLILPPVSKRKQFQLDFFLLLWVPSRGVNHLTDRGASRLKWHGVAGHKSHTFQPYIPLLLIQSTEERRTDLQITTMLLKNAVKTHLRSLQEGWKGTALSRNTEHRITRTKCRADIKLCHSASQARSQTLKLTSLKLFLPLTLSLPCGGDRRRKDVQGLVQQLTPAVPATQEP